MQSWRGSTFKQYRTSTSKWIHFCSERSRDPLRTDVTLVLEFLNSLHKNELSYSSVNSARNALSAFAVLEDGTNVGTNSFVVRFMKGIFQSETSKAKVQHRMDWQGSYDLLDITRRKQELIPKVANT